MDEIGYVNPSTMVSKKDPSDIVQDFPTPMWGTRALCHFLRGIGYDLSTMSAREPCANRGYMVKPLSEFFASVDASDIKDYGMGYPVRDFTDTDGLFAEETEFPDFDVYNPPFGLAQQFLERSMREARRGICILIRTSWSESSERYWSIFRDNPAAYKLTFSQRLAMFQGQTVPSWARYEDDHPNPKKAGRHMTSATSYSWFIWLKGDSAPTRDLIIPPVRGQLERDTDYPDWQGNARTDAQRRNAEQTRHDMGRLKRGLR